jgi:hypothetical protein
LAHSPDHGQAGSGVIGDALVNGVAIVYRLYDVGFEINLDRVFEILAATDSASANPGGGPSRLRPIRGEAQAIQIANPPVTIDLGTEPLTTLPSGARAPANVSARIFDFGVVSLRLRIPATEMTWAEFTEFGNAVDVGVDLSPMFERYLGALLARIEPAVERPAVAPVTEDYIVFRITPPASAGDVRADAWRDEDIAPLLLNERRPLSATARRELLPHRFSYYTDDLTILTWDNALIVEPTEDDADVQYILEFANAQLLELRVYDAILDGQLPAVYDRVGAARARAGLWRGRYAAILADLQALVADSTELVERVESALKVTDDVYLARIYTAALEIFRGRDWRAAIDRKLAIIRETYVMLNAEAQAARSEALEVLIVVLITAEILLALLHR